MYLINRIPNHAPYQGPTFFNKPKEFQGYFEHEPLRMIRLFIKRIYSPILVLYSVYELCL